MFYGKFLNNYTRNRQDLRSSGLLVISYRRFGPPIGPNSLRNSPEERSSPLLRGGSLKSRQIIDKCNFVMEHAVRC